MRRGLHAVGTAIAAVALLFLLADASRAQEVTTEVHFIVDGSGSISGTDWQIEKDALVAALQDHAYFPHDGTISVAIVQFGTNDNGAVARIELSPTVVTLNSRPSLIAAVQDMVQIGGGTAAGAGILTAELGLGGAEGRLCVLTDGVNNAGQDPVSAAALAQDAGADRLAVVALADPEQSFNRVVAEAAYDPVVFGDGRVTFVRNSAEFSAVLASACMSPRLRLRGFEVNQAVQDWQGTVPLVETRETLVRAFLEPPIDCEQPPPTPEFRTAVRLRGSRDGVELPGSPLMAGNDRTAVDAVCHPTRGAIESGAWFRLPISWLSGTVELELEVPGGVLCEAVGMDPPEPMDPPDPDPPCRRTVTFTPTEFPGMQLRIMRWRDPDTGELSPPPDIEQAQEQIRRVRTQLPIASWESAGAARPQFEIDIDLDILPPAPFPTYDCDGDGVLTFMDPPLCGTEADVVSTCDRGEDPDCDVAGSRCDLPSRCLVSGVNEFDYVHARDKLVKEVIKRLMALRCPDKSGCEEEPLYYGLLGGLDRYGGALRESGVAMSFLAEPGRLDQGYWRNTVPHEVAHLLGRPHPLDPEGPGSKGPCGEKSGDTTPFPYLGEMDFERTALMGPEAPPEAQMWGVDIELFTQLAPDPGEHLLLPIADPERTPEVMSYCNRFPEDPGQGGWVSDYTYGALFDTLRADADPQPALVPGVISPEGDHLHLRGFVEGGDVRLSPVLPVDGPATLEPDSSPLVVEFLGASDVLLAQARIALGELESRGPPDPEGLDEVLEAFSSIVADPGGGWVALALVLDGIEVARLPRSAAFPELTLEEPAAGAVLDTDVVEFAWTGSDADGDPLAYAVEYSADDGATWETLAVDTEQTRVELERYWLPASSAARLRVLASDGLNTTTVESGPFEVVDSPPVYLAIDSPVSGQSFASTQRVFLRATAWDGGEGFLDEGAIDWVSSRQGVVGTGARVDLEATDLLEGPHDLTAIATDSAGNAVEQTVSIDISRVPPPPPDFEPQISPAVQPANPGGTAEFLVTIVPLRGFDQPVEVELAPLPEGWSGGIGPKTLLPGQAAVVTIQIPEDAEEATVPVDVIARSGEIVYRTGMDAEVVFGLIPECFGDIAGRVIDIETGEPIEGVQIRVSLTGVVFATTDALGEFRFEGLRPRTYGYWAVDDAYWPESRSMHVICDGETPVIYELLRKRFGTLTGRVVEGVVDPSSGAVVPTDVGVPDATVNVDFSAPLQADAEGRFFSEMELNPENQPRNYDIRGRASGYWDGTKTRVTVADGIVTELDLPVVPICRYGGTITGQVVDQNGDPVENSTVGAPFANRATTSDADGRFRIDYTDAILAHNNAPRPASVSANPPPGSEPGSTRGDALFTIPSEACEQGFDLDVTLEILLVPPPIENRGVIFGQVRDIETGEPIVGARVLTGSAPNQVQDTTDEQGFYRLENVLIGIGEVTSGQATVGTSPDDYWNDSVSAEVFAFQDNRVDIELLRIRTGSVEGYVRDAVTGEPVPRASVGGFGLNNRPTDENGYYRIEGVQLFRDNEPRLYDIAARRRETVTDTEYFLQELSFLAEADQTRRVDFELIERCGNAIVRGVVVNAETLEPIEGARLTGGQFAVFTDAQGRFELEARVGIDSNAPRNVDITASAAGFISLTRRITVFCGAQITLNFGRDGGTSSIAGTVTRSDTGAPISGVFIGSEFGQVDTTGLDGTYRLDAAPLSPDGSEATWNVGATWNGTELVAPVTVRAGEEARQDFVFPPPAELDVSVDREQTVLDPVARTLTSRARITLTNNSPTTATHPIRITFAPDAPGVRVPDAGGVDPQGNSFYLLEPHAGVTSIPPGESAQFEVTFVRDAPLAFRYEIQVTSASAPIGIFPALADADLDGWVDGVDVCPQVPDGLQADSGGLHDAPADGIGDACQCGDVDLDGRVTLRDTIRLARVLAGLGGEIDAARCDVAADVGDAERCDPLDLLRLRLALAGGPPPEQVCPAAAGVGP